MLGFTRTLGFRHGSIPAARAALTRLGADGGWSVQWTEDPATFTAEALANTDVVAFVLTSGDVLGPPEQDLVEAFIRRGGGFVGVHSAHDTEYDWPFYGELVGAYFKSHPAIQVATVRAEDGGHPASLPFAPTAVRTDEWYDFRTNPRGSVTVLLTVDESSYTGGTMGADHPIAWCRQLGAGRSFTTAMGHTDESWAEGAFLAHVAAGLRWAAGR